MHPKLDMLSAIMTVWMMAAVSCAALPFLHDAGQFGGFVPFFIAVILGLLAGVSLSFAVRRLCLVEAPTKDMWAFLTPAAAAFFGIVGWSLPIGLMFALDEFLRSKSWAVVVPNAVIWPVAGVCFGLAMRWFAVRRQRRKPA